MPFAMLCLLSLLRVLLRPMHLERTPLGLFFRAMLWPGKYSIVLAIGQIGTPHATALSWQAPGRCRCKPHRQRLPAVGRSCLLPWALLCQALNAVAEPCGGPPNSQMDPGSRHPRAVRLAPAGTPPSHVPSSGIMARIGAIHFSLRTSPDMTGIPDLHLHQATCSSRLRKHVLN